MQTAALDPCTSVCQMERDFHDSPAVPLSLAQYFDRSDRSALGTTFPAKVGILKLTHSSHKLPQLGTLTGGFDPPEQA
jgi:hypothetical protein